MTKVALSELFLCEKASIMNAQHVRGIEACAGAKRGRERGAGARELVRRLSFLHGLVLPRVRRREPKLQQQSASV